MKIRYIKYWAFAAVLGMGTVTGHRTKRIKRYIE